jgi:membrane protein
MRWKGLLGLVRETACGWWERGPFEMGAALAFYGAFALAPTLVIAIAVAGLIFGEDAAQGRLDATLGQAVGPDVARALAEALAQVHASGSGWSATGAGVGLALFIATGLFMQLQLALNAIWGVQPRPGRGLRNMARSRLLALLMVLGVAALLLLSMAAHAVLAALDASLPPASRAGDSLVWEAGERALPLLLLVLLVALIYRLLPDAIIAWRDVWVGAAVTALLLAPGNYLISQYLYRAAPASVYGPAGCLVVVMLWVYYSSQILLFGAEFTKRFADRYGKPVRPANYAMCRPGRAPAGPSVEHHQRSVETGDAPRSGTTHPAGAAVGDPG